MSPDSEEEFEQGPPASAWLTAGREDQHREGFEPRQPEWLAPREIKEEELEYGG